MKRKEIISEVANKLNCTKKDAELFIKAYEEVVFEAVSAGKKVRISEIGILSTIEIPDKNARNPRTGELIVVKGHGKVKFRVAKALKLSVK